MGSCALPLMLSLTPMGEPTRSLLALSSATKGDAGQVILFLYPLQCIQLIFQIIFFFHLSSVLEFFCWKPEFPQRLSCPCMIQSDTVALQGLQTMAKRGWGWFTGHCSVHRPDRSLYAYYTTDWWVRLLPGLLAYDTGSLSSHKDFFCPWMDAKLLSLKREI